MADSRAVGQKIIVARRVTEDEAEEEGWDDVCGSAIVLTLEGGTKLYPLRTKRATEPGRCL